MGDPTSVGIPRSILARFITDPKQLASINADRDDTVTLQEVDAFEQAHMPQGVAAMLPDWTGERTTSHRLAQVARTEILDFQKWDEGKFRSFQFNPAQPPRANDDGSVSIDAMPEKFGTVQITVFPDGRISAGVLGEPTLKPISDEEVENVRDRLLEYAAHDETFSQIRVYRDRYHQSSFAPQKVSATPGGQRITSYLAPQTAN